MEIIDFETAVDDLIERFHESDEDRERDAIRIVLSGLVECGAFSRLK